MVRLTPGTIEHLDARIAHMRWAKVKGKSIGLRNVADKIFSVWRRYGESWIDINGQYWARCISCGRTYPTVDIHAGHWIPKGSHVWVRWRDDNVWPQCATCNHFLHGNIYKYEQALRAKKINVDYLLQLKDKPGRPSNDEMREFILWCGEKCIQHGFDISRVTY